jgi:hypothetical protein
MMSIIIFFVSAIAYLYIFASGLMAGSLIRNFIEGGKFPSKFSNHFNNISASFRVNST